MSSPAHCVQLDHNDIRMLKVLDVKVANNVVSNMFLASASRPSRRWCSPG